LEGGSCKEADGFHEEEGDHGEDCYVGNDGSSFGPLEKIHGDFSIHVQVGRPLSRPCHDLRFVLVSLEL